MKIPEGFTPRGDSNEQPPETYDKKVLIVLDNPFGTAASEIAVTANGLSFWKIPDGPLRVAAYKVLP